jgi:hypothetical protein
MLFSYSLQIQEPFKIKLKDGIQSQYAGLNGTNLVSQGWNVVMQKVLYFVVDMPFG